MATHATTDKPHMFMGTETPGSLRGATRVEETIGMTRTGMLPAESQSGAAQASMDTDFTESLKLMTEGTDMVGMCMGTGVRTGPLTDSVV